MDTREFLKRYAWVYFYVAAFFLATAGLFLHSVETAGEWEPISLGPVIVIDAGHGEPDGGATGVAGTREAEVNLAIARRLELLLTLFGCETVMTRTGPDSVASAGETIRQRKQEDLRLRAELVNAQAEAILVSIHQNHFPQGRFSGPQVFWSGDAENLAVRLQQALNDGLSPGSNRRAKEAAGLYLMTHIDHPGVLVECGFLSNAEEERRLASAEHQKKIAAILAAILLEYQTVEHVS